MGRSVGIPAELRKSPFGLETASALGVSRDVLRSARFTRPFRGVYVWHEIADEPRTAVEAALLAAPPGSWVSHSTALRLWGIEVGPVYPIHLSSCHLREIVLSGVVVHRRRYGPKLRMRDGLLVASPERCWAESCLHLDFVRRVVVADWLLREHLSRTELSDYVSRTHVGGVRRARVALRHAAVGVDSPPETVVRLGLVLARLPSPSVNEAVSEHGLYIRPDLIFERYKIAIEYDGDYHFLSREQRERDNLRRETLERAGWIVIVLTAESMRNVRRVVMRVYTALRGRGYAGPVPVFSDMWSRWFERP